MFETSHVKHRSHLQKSWFTYQVFNCNSGNIFFIRKAAIRICILCERKYRHSPSPTMSFNILKDIFSSEPMDFLDLRLSAYKRGTPGYIGTILSRLPAHISETLFHFIEQLTEVNLTVLYIHTHTVNIIIHIYSLI